MISQRAVDAIEGSDTDELLRVIDGYCEGRSWDTLLDLRSRCREAVGRGKQLWGVEEHLRYRLALEAPGEYAGPIISEGAARFALGPLAEVAASTKSWAELSQHLDHGPERMTVAAERVVRGEAGIGPIHDLPDRLLGWEPRYPLATYKPDKVDAPSPRLPEVSLVDLPDEVARISDPESEGALADLVAPWAEESNGHREVATVEGSHLGAIRALGLTRTRVGSIDPASALAWMAWAGASGGAHGRRRGAAAGRYGAWWVVAALGDLDWPPGASDMHETLRRLSWYWFDDGAPGTGWQLRVAVEDRDTGLAWAIAAVDAAD